MIGVSLWLWRCWTIGLVLIFLGACQPAIFTDGEYKTPHSQRKYAYNPTAAAYNVQLAMAYLHQGEWDRSKQKLLIAEYQDPNSALVLDAMGYFLELTGEPQQAQNYYLKAIRLNPKLGMAYNNYGTFLCRQRHYQAAEKQFLFAIQDTQYLATGEAYENAGLCALQDQQYVKAEQYLLKAIQKQPKLVNSLLSLARLNYNNQNYRMAEQYLWQFNQLAKAEPESLSLAILLADKAQNQQVVAANLATLGQYFPNSNEYLTMRKHYG